MTVKEFFKSTAFKCVATLLCVLLVCGVFLTVMNGLLEVTEDDKLNRILSDIYGKSVTAEEQDISGKNTDLSSAKINNVYLVKDDGNYILNVTGKNAYQGQVLCWVVIKPSSDKKSVGGIGTVQVPAAGNESQSFLNKINSKVFANFERDYKEGIVYSYGFDENGGSGEMYVETGASYTMRGVCNAVNGCITFMNAFLSGGNIVEEDPYKDYAYHSFINMEETDWVKNGTEITYNIVTKGNSPAEQFKITVSVDASKTVKSFEITVFGSTSNDFEDYDKEHYNDIVKANAAKFIGKNADYFAAVLGEDETAAGSDKFAENELTAGATKSTVLCLSAAAFATANYDLIMNSVEYSKLIDLKNTSWTVNGEEITVEITTKGNSPAEQFKITVSVDASKTVKSFEITVFGSTSNDFEDYDKEHYNDIVKANAAKFTGKNADYFAAVLGKDETAAGSDKFAENELTAGATKSTILCLSAAAFATANYGYFLTHSSGGQSNE